MGKTTIAKDIKREVTFLGKRGTYRFPFSPDIGDVNKDPDKYEQYRVKSDEEVEALNATQPPTQPVQPSVNEIQLNGKTYRKITGDEETIELNGEKYRAV